MTSTGKRARKTGGNRHACKRLRARRNKTRRTFGKLPISVAAGNAERFVLRGDR